MELVIRGDKIQVTEAMKAYIEDKLQRLEKYLKNNDDVKATIVIKVKDRRQKIEITIPLHNFILRAEEEQPDFYAAVDAIIDKLERQVRKNKTRLQRQAPTVVEEFIYSEVEEEEPEELIVKRKKIAVKPMTEEEAIIQMELLGHQFYLYKDAETNQPTLIYKRNDGGYGIIEAE